VHNQHFSPAPLPFHRRTQLHRFSQQVRPVQSSPALPPPFNRPVIRVQPHIIYVYCILPSPPPPHTHTHAHARAETCEESQSVRPQPEVFWNASVRPSARPSFRGAADPGTQQQPRSARLGWAGLGWTGLGWAGGFRKCCSMYSTIPHTHASSRDGGVRRKGAGDVASRCRHRCRGHGNVAAVSPLVPDLTHRAARSIGDYTAAAAAAAAVRYACV